MAAQGAALQNHNNELVRCTYFTTPRALMRTAGGGGGADGRCRWNERGQTQKLDSDDALTINVKSTKLTTQRVALYTHK